MSEDDTMAELLTFVRVPSLLLSDKGSIFCMTALFSSRFDTPVFGASPHAGL